MQSLRRNGLNTNATVFWIVFVTFPHIQAESSLASHKWWMKPLAKPKSLVTFSRAMRRNELKPYMSHALEEQRGGGGGGG